MQTRPHVRPQATRGGLMKGCLIAVGIVDQICVVLGLVAEKAQKAA